MIAFVRLRRLVRRPFHPVTIASKIGMIEDMISKLMTEANEANAKAFCDEEHAKAQKSQAEKTSLSDKFTARVAEAANKSEILKDAVAELQKELAEIDKAQAETNEAANAKASATRRTPRRGSPRRRRPPSSTSSPRCGLFFHHFHTRERHYVATHARCKG